MEYIECTHCGKRYAAIRVKNNIGGYIRCDNCLEKFQAVVKILEKKGSNIEETWDPTLTAAPKRADTPENSALPSKVVSDSLPEQEDEVLVDSDKRKSKAVDWDPADTMPEPLPEQSNHEDSLSDEETQAKAEAALQDIKQAKKKQLVVYTILFIVVALLALSLFVALSSDEPQDFVVQHSQVAPRLSAEDVDKKSVECRIAAARQWLLDDKVMHEDYDANSFTKMLKQAENRGADVKDACKNPRLLEVIIDAATKGEKPDWFANEIQAISRE